MRLDQWQALGIVCGSIIALMTLIGLLYRWVVRPVWRTLRRLNEVADQLLGDKNRRIPSMTERMSALESKLDEHLAWHNPTTKTNGPTPLRTPRR
jgi:hypothetical protein